MNNWTVRKLIISAFTAVILVMAALGVFTVFKLREINRDAMLLENDVLPGVLLSGQRNSFANFFWWNRHEAQTESIAQRIIGIKRCTWNKCDVLQNRFIKQRQG